MIYATRLTLMGHDGGQLSRDRIEDLADIAISTGELVTAHGLVVVPDVVMAEAIANCETNIPPAPRLAREDGRSAYLYSERPEAER